MVLVPHEDDEILTAGSLIHILAENGTKVYVVYASNGDWKYTAKTRFKEAIDSALILGIPSSNVIFLGYGDSAPESSREHIFNSWSGTVASPAGHLHTYGIKNHQDFAFQYRGVHSDYNAQNYLNDIVDVILSIKPGFIICSDFDEHPDHKMLSLFFDRAMGIIRKQYPDYTPFIWKRFAYSLAYNAVSDYTVINNPETMRPEVGITSKYVKDIIDTSIYCWKDRIRIPTIDTGKEPICKSTLGRALLKHKSQYIIRNADRIINSDEVYWSRRTDGVSYCAKVETSSGNGDYLNDFMLMNICNIDTSDSAYVDYYWKPEECDKEKTVKFSWDEEQIIEEIVLYGAIAEDSQIEELQIKLSNGKIFTINDIPNNGNPVSVDIGYCEGIKSVEITILSARGDNYGLSECEFYACKKEPECINPFIKILVNDNFVYEYVIPEHEKELQLGLYTYGIENPKEQIKIIEGKSKIVNNRLLIDSADQIIILRVEDGSAWDQVVIKKASQSEMKKLESLNRADLKFLKRQRALFRIHNMLYILKHQGVLSVLKRTAKNGVFGTFR